MKSESIRYILVTLIKVLLVIVGMLVLFFVGTAIGYGVIGDGDPFKVFDGEIWEHIFSFLK